MGELAAGYSDTWRHCGWGGDFSFLIPDRPEDSIAHAVAGEVPIRFLRTRSIEPQIFKAQLEAIRRARSYIYIENCYFSDDRILYELCRASRRGVDVRLILPVEVNHKVMARSNRVAINTLLKHGGRVFLYPRMTHAKAAVYDGWACVGTANFDKLSFQVNRENNLATSHPETVENLIAQLFEPDFEESQEITEPVSINFADHLYELLGDET